MSLSIPVDFTTLTGKANESGGYPTQINAADLQKNFVYCALDTADDLVEASTGPGGMATRKLKILPGNKQGQFLYWNGKEYAPFSQPPSSGTWILGAVDGEVDWLATEEC